MRVCKSRSQLSLTILAGISVGEYTDVGVVSDECTDEELEEEPCSEMHLGAEEEDEANRRSSVSYCREEVDSPKFLVISEHSSILTFLVCPKRYPRNSKGDQPSAKVRPL